MGTTARWPVIVAASVLLVGLPATAAPDKITDPDALFDAIQKIAGKKGSVCLGEKHTDPFARTFLIKHMGALHKAGVRYLCIEAWGDFPVGDLIGADETLTLEEALKAQGKKPDKDTLEALELAMNKIFKGREVGLGSVARAAIEARVKVVCYDYDPTDTKRNKKRNLSMNKHAAPIIQKKVKKDACLILVGADHLDEGLGKNALQVLVGCEAITTTD